MQSFMKWKKGAPGRALLTRLCRCSQRHHAAIRYNSTTTNPLQIRKRRIPGRSIILSLHLISFLRPTF